MLFWEYTPRAVPISILIWNSLVLLDAHDLSPFLLDAKTLQPKRHPKIKCYPSRQIVECFTRQANRLAMAFFITLYVYFLQRIQLQCRPQSINRFPPFEWDPLAGETNGLYCTYRVTYEEGNSCGDKKEYLFW